MHCRGLRRLNDLSNSICNNRFAQRGHLEIKWQLIQNRISDLALPFSPSLKEIRGDTIGLDTHFRLFQKRRYYLLKRL